jgi:hypothetical protein
MLDTTPNRRLRRPPNRRHTAIHEAGHVAAYCHLTHGIHGARLAGPDQTIVDRRGRAVPCLGLTEACTSFNEPVLWPSKVKDIRDIKIDNVAPEDSAKMYAAVYEGACASWCASWPGHMPRRNTESNPLSPSV